MLRSEGRRRLGVIRKIYPGRQTEEEGRAAERTARLSVSISHLIASRRYSHLEKNYAPQCAREFRRAQKTYSTFC